MKLWESVSSFSVYTHCFILFSFWKTQKYPRYTIRNLKINGKPQKLSFPFCLFLFFSFLCGSFWGKISVTCVSNCQSFSGLLLTCLAYPSPGFPRVAEIRTPSRLHCEESYSGLLNLEKCLSFVNHIRVLPGQYFVFAARAQSPRGVMKSYVCSENRP